ncbi:MAG TPA: selenoneine synthase SenA [Candidatus Angelobacter sp.]|nr:selenoneine synthase SenA [Candidatus Angelobacter sp.]
MNVQAPADADLAAWVRDARARTLDLVADLSDEQMMGPQLSIVNPPLWEIGHVAWFQEKWVLRHAAGESPVRSGVDGLYDSAAVAHDTRWDLKLPSRRETLDYLTTVRDAVLERIEAGNLSENHRYFIQLSIFHEDMHNEAFAYTRQTHGYRAPGSCRRQTSSVAGEAGPLRGDAEIPGGRFMLGAFPELSFVFDNEKWAHAVEVRPFAMARAAVTQGEFLDFVEAGGYRRPEFWGESGLKWLRGAGAEHPLYWHREAAGRWLRRDFDRWLPLEPHRAVLHVNWWEAEAYCNWAGRRLPTEAEWEVAASSEPAGHGLAQTKRLFPWGDSFPSAGQANLGGASGGTVDVAALPAGDSAFGCRQLIGNVWEWVADNFEPYPGFEVDPYREYSQPWFGTHKVLRGGAWITQPRLLRNTWRNFYTPDRRDVWAGFRTCRRDPA